MLLRRAICIPVLMLMGLLVRSSVAAESVEAVFGEILTGARPAIEASGLDTAMRFYAGHQGRPVWWLGDRWSEKAETALEILKNADAEGLNSRDYLGTERQLPPSAASVERIAEFELRLSIGLLRYIVDVQTGRKAPKDIDPQLFVYPREVVADRELRHGLSTPDFNAWLRGLSPQGVEYRWMKQLLSDYRSLAESPWPRLEDGPSLKAGLQDSRVAILRRQLELLGDLQSDNGQDESSFDSVLTAAVMRFQGRHGLDADGVVGPATRRALNTPISKRIVQIVLNMERLRWVPDDPGRRHIRVNIASFELVVFEDGQVVSRMPVVVGRHYRRTPVFSDVMTNLVLNPSWTPTPNIARQDILPKVRADIGYLARQKIRVFENWGADAVELDPASIDWSTVTKKSLPYKFRQDPGPENALGRIRFSLNNKLSIYLHDTPDRGLFSKNIRTFSSGCIRVGDPLALGLFALGANGDWSSERLVAALDTGVTQTVKLASPLPVHLTYMTAWVDPVDGPQFRDDLYGRDHLLARALGLDDAR